MDEIIVGGNSANGTVSVHGTDNQPLIELLGRSSEAVIGAGQKSRPGRLTMYNGQGLQTVNLSTVDAALSLGSNATNGRVSVYGADGKPLIELLGRANESVIGLGQTERPGRISIYNSSGTEAIRLDGNAGDIWLANADCAEEFDLDVSDIEPGMVMVLTDTGRLIPSSTSYDTKVTGVISGAGAYRPGLVLDRQNSVGAKRIPIALMGKVFCRVDASNTPVRVGDLLTTSEREGYAMRVTDSQRAFGAVLGKALAALTSGCDLIPILVALQ